MIITEKKLIRSKNSGYYHLVSRCVRGASLYGIDKRTGKNYDYRDSWIKNQILYLANYFSVEIYAYAVQRSHYHLIVYSDPNLPDSWSDREVAERWLSVFPGQLDKLEFSAQRKQRLKLIAESPNLLAEYRKRLGDLSWFLRCVNEPLTRKISAEMLAKDQFFKSQFHLYALVGEASILACMAYVETSLTKARASTSSKNKALTSVRHRMNSSYSSKSLNEINGIAGKIGKSKLSLSFAEYRKLLKWTENRRKHKKISDISTSILSTLKTMKLDQNDWLSLVEGYGSLSYRLSGKLSNTKRKIKAFGLRWSKGTRDIRSFCLHLVLDRRGNRSNNFSHYDNKLYLPTSHA